MACSMHWGDDKGIPTSSQKSEGKSPLGKPVDKWKKNNAMDLHERMSTGFIWLRISSCEHGNKRWGIKFE